jgi:hypothetical protein
MRRCWARLRHRGLCRGMPVEYCAGNHGSSELPTGRTGWPRAGLFSSNARRAWTASDGRMDMATRHASLAASVRPEALPSSGQKSSRSERGIFWFPRKVWVRHARARKMEKKTAKQSRAVHAATGRGADLYMTRPRRVCLETLDATANADLFSGTFASYFYR